MTFLEFRKNDLLTCGAHLIARLKSFLALNEERNDWSRKVTGHTVSMTCVQVVSQRVMPDPFDRARSNTRVDRRHLVRSGSLTSPLLKLTDGSAEIAGIVAQCSLGPEGGGSDVRNATVFNR